MLKFQNSFISLIISYKVRKIQLFSVVLPTMPEQAISFIFYQKSSIGQIGSNQQQKWIDRGCGVMQTFLESFISLIISYIDRKIQLCSVVPPNKWAQAIIYIFS